MIEQRFSGVIGMDYALFTDAYPHFFELERTIASTIAKDADKKLNVSCDCKRNYFVLEIGCGPGPTTKEILDTREEISVDAVDNEPNMILQAKDYLSVFEEKQRLKLVTEDALLFLRQQENEKYDAFASGWTLHNFYRDYRSEVLAEIYRVMRKDGVFVNGDKYADDNPKEHSVQLEWSLNRLYDTYTRNGREDLRDAWLVHMVEDNMPERMMRESESRKEMSEIGFKDVMSIWRMQMEAVMIARK